MNVCIRAYLHVCLRSNIYVYLLNVRSLAVTHYSWKIIHENAQTFSYTVKQIHFVWVFLYTYLWNCSNRVHNKFIKVYVKLPAVYHIVLKGNFVHLLSTLRFLIKVSQYILNMSSLITLEKKADAFTVLYISIYIRAPITEGRLSSCTVRLPPRAPWFLPILWRNVFSRILELIINTRLPEELCFFPYLDI